VTARSGLAASDNTDSDVDEHPGATSEDALDSGPIDSADSADVTSADSDVSELEASVEGDESDSEASAGRWSGARRGAVFVLIPLMAMALAAAAGLFKWQAGSRHADSLAAAQSVQAATEGTIALLSYRPDSVEHDLGAARDRLTGDFLDSYTSLTTKVVIPGAKQKQISATATVPAAASVSATPQHAIVLVYINQSTTIGSDPATDTNSCVQVTLDRRGDRWLISKFDPI
jgi:Mce-associated membrane protein